MAEKIDMSLEDLMAQKKPKAQKERLGPKRREGGRGRGRRGQIGRSGPKRSYVHVRSEPYVRRDDRPLRLELSRSDDGPWRHDMYIAQEKEELGFVASAPNNKPSLTTGTKLVVSNLDEGVEEEDLKGFFGPIGSLKSLKLEGNGVAHVVYRRRADAEKAIDEFDGRELDNKIMSVKLLAPGAVPSGPKPRPRLGPKPVRAGPVRGRGAAKFGSVDRFGEADEAFEAEVMEAMEVVEVPQQLAYSGQTLQQQIILAQQRATAEDVTFMVNIDAPDGGRQQRRQRQKPQFRQQRGSRGGRGKGRVSKPRQERQEVSATDLDAEMDAYRQSAPKEDDE